MCYATLVLIDVVHTHWTFAFHLELEFAVLNINRLEVAFSSFLTVFNFVFRGLDTYGQVMVSGAMWRLGRGKLF